MRQKIISGSVCGYLDCIDLKVFSDPVLNTLSRSKGPTEPESATYDSFTVVMIPIGSSLKSFTSNGIFSLKRFFLSIPIMQGVFHNFFGFTDKYYKGASPVVKKFIRKCVLRRMQFRPISV